MAEGKVANNCAIVLYAGKSDEIRIKGLTSITLPLGFQASNVTVDTMGVRIGTLLATGGTWEELSLSYNFIPDDATQEKLQELSVNGVTVNDLRFYIDYKTEGDFAALDLISDPEAVYTVGTFSSPTANKNELLTGSISILPGGASILYKKHASGADLAFTADAGSGATITDSGATMNFVTDRGFAAGDTIILDHVNNLNPLHCKIASVTDTVITLASDGDADSVPTFTGVANTAIHAGTPLVVAGLV